MQAPANDTPGIAGNPAPSVVAGSAYSFTPSTTDPVGPASGFLHSGPALMGILLGEHRSARRDTRFRRRRHLSGHHHQRQRRQRKRSLPAFAIKVKALRGAPSIGGTPPASVVAGTCLCIHAHGERSRWQHAHLLSYSLPPWASFSSSTGELSGTPTKSAVGTYSNIVISASNGTATSSLPAFSIEVDAPPDQAPIIGGSPATSVVAGSAYGFTPTASSPEGNPLTFSVANLPSWANFSSSTGRLSGAPSAASVGTFSNIVISVSDGTLSASLASFAITVTAPVYPPPTIGGAPATSVAAGAVYSFTPSTTDPSGNPLTFSIQNLPSWAAFNAQSGILSGTPGAGDVGTYTGIVISVTDGTSSASLAAFSISVTEPATGSATLTWAAPTQNTNGTPLTNLAGFHIYYGTSAGNLNQSVQISNPGSTSYTFNNLPAGTWYFSINDYTTAGVESAVSNIANTTVP